MTYPATQTFWVEENGECLVALRRYTNSTGGWTCAEGWHHAMSPQIGTVPSNVDDEGVMHPDPGEIPHDDSRWPTHCQTGCGYAFTDEDRWQVWTDRMYVNPATSEVWPKRDLPPGATYSAPWYRRFYDRQTPPDDGITLCVKLPNGHDWCVDSEASNCDRKGQEHSCWVRSGDPRKAEVTAGKSGNTCSAGAGSILSGDYHGFLQSGVLTAG
jgi:hypothetical protein